MRLFFLIFLGNFIVCSSWAQQELTLFHLNDLPQADHTNPSYFTGHEWSFSSPSLALNFGNTGFAYNDLIRPLEGTDSMQVDVDHALAQMDNWNHLIVNLHVSYFNIKHQLGDHQVGVQVTDKLNGRVIYPRELPEFLWKGNEPFIGENVDIGPSIQAIKYREYAVNWAYKPRKKVTMGVKVAYLQGLANFSTSKNKFEVHTDTANHELTINTNYRVNTYHPERLTDLVPPFRFDSDAHGASLGLGVTAPLFDDLKVSASLMDLGFINWSGQAEVMESKGSYTFKGIDPAGFVRKDSFALNSYLDTLQDRFGFKKTQRAFTTQLPPKLRIGLFYNLDSSHYLGLSYYQEMVKHRHPSITVFYQHKFRDLFGTAFRFSPGVSYSYRNRSFSNLGISGILGYKSLEVFIVGDNLLSWFFPRAVVPFKELTPVFSSDTEGQVTLPRNFRNYNLRVGLNIGF